MKKRLGIPAVLAIAALLLTSCAMGAKITVDEAKEIALKEADVHNDAVQGLTAHLERDDGRIYYEVDFYADAVDYDVDIDARTGEILKFDREGEAASTPITPPTTAAPTEADAILTKEQASEIALEDTGFTADQVRRLTARLDRDNGKTHYDVEFFQDGTEYDYEIDAKTGAILSFDTEYIG